MTLSYNNFIVNLASEIDKLTNHFVFDGYSALASLLKAPLGAMIVLYIVLMGYAIVRGMVQTPQQELFKFAIRAGAIYMTAMNWSFFSEHIRDLFVVGSESIATTLMHAVHKGASGSVNQGLQNVLNEILELGSQLFEAGSYRKLSPYLAGMMVFISGGVTVGLAFIEIVIAKLMLAITLCTAPLFIIFTLFDQTKSFFDRWLGILIGFSLVLVFVSSVVGLCMHLLHFVAEGVFSQSSSLKAAIWVPLFIVSSLCVMCITQAANIGKSIGGALCTSNGSAMLGGFIGSSFGTLAFSKNSLKNSKEGFKKARDIDRRVTGFGKNIAQGVFKHMQQNLRRGK